MILITRLPTVPERLVINIIYGCKKNGREGTGGPECKTWLAFEGILVPVFPRDSRGLPMILMAKAKIRGESAAFLHL